MKMLSVNINYETLQRLFKGERVTVRIPSPPRLTPQVPVGRRAFNTARVSLPHTLSPADFQLTVDTLNISQMTNLCALVVERDTRRMPPLVKRKSK